MRLQLRQADLVVIDRAANLRGQSRTDFMREAAARAAEEVLMESTPIRMSPKDFDAFMAAIAAPAAAVPSLVDLLKRRAPWDRAEGA